MRGFQHTEKKALNPWPSPEVDIKLAGRYTEHEHHLTLFAVIKSDDLETFILYLLYLNLIPFEFLLPLSLALFWTASPMRFFWVCHFHLQLLVQILDVHSFFCPHVGRGKRCSYMKNANKREYKQTHSLWSGRIVSYQYLGPQ